MLDTVMCHAINSWTPCGKLSILKKVFYKVTAGAFPSKSILHIFNHYEHQS